MQKVQAHGANNVPQGWRSESYTVGADREILHCILGFYFSLLEE